MGLARFEIWQARVAGEKLTSTVEHVF